MEAGYIYIMFMSELPHCLKVGHSMREPEIRAKELSGTASPLPFRVLMQWHVTDVAAAEKAAHESLASERVASNREFFHVTGPEAIERVANAIRPFIRSQLDRALRDDIASACLEFSAKYLRRDIRTKPPVATANETYSRLSDQLHNIVLSSATRLLDESNDPRAILSVVDVVGMYFEGPIHLDNSPEELLSLFFYHVGLLTYMMDTAAYLTVGSNYFAPSVLNIIANISRAVSNVMTQENEEFNSPEE